MIIHKINSLIELEPLLIHFKNNNYGYVSYIAGEYGMVIKMYKIYVYEFYQELKKNNIKTVGFVFKNTTSFLYNCCDEIIEYQNIEIDDINNDMSSYEDNDGCAMQYTRGMKNFKYEELLEKINFKHIFYTLFADGSVFANKKNNYDNIPHNSNIILYEILNNNYSVYIRFSYDNLTYSQPFIINSNKSKNKCIAIWIRNTNKWPGRNMLIETYESVFNYCINNNITCYVFMDLIQIELPNSKYIINSTNRFKNRPNWDNFLNILSKCDFYIGSNSGSSEIVLFNAKINMLFESIETCNSIFNKIRNKNKEDGYYCDIYNIKDQFALIMNDYYK